MADPFHPRRWDELTYDDNGLQGDELTENYAAVTAAYDEAHEAGIFSNLNSPEKRKTKATSPKEKCKRRKVKV